MSAIIMDGKKLAGEMLEELKNKVFGLNKKPHLTVILVGDNPASQIYVSSKEKRAKEIGFLVNVLRLPSEISKEELLNEIDILNKSETDAIILQLPLPKHLNEDDFASAIIPAKDVDGFNPYNMGCLLRGEKPYAIPCTPKGIMYLLEKYNINLEGKNCVVVGRSNIVGKPMAHLLLQKNATVTIAHSKTKNLSLITKNADVIISATGIKKLIKADMVKNGAVVIDVGISRDENNKITGDVDFENVKEIAGYITPTPGGVGPMTVAELMQNTFELGMK
ncbi:MAG: bifunctional 5,10-methylenetetrahydrofolate dehydrogenase/5,10-methenyltetrahydrofolate cyclohydrolase [Cyanobacteria bacterium SIG30]|nr:bifunctional 5,10-methylenetetrahydrofolate dehydrogenase/5,10-methenyltetrahydrofolate cyclohydrolase [Cyanobacteria bacterium SIG30]